MALGLRVLWKFSVAKTGSGLAVAARLRPLRSNIFRASVLAPGDQVRHDFTAHPVVRRGDTHKPVFLSMDGGRMSTSLRLL